MEYFKIQDIFHARMWKDYENGLITNPIYRQYFQWKFYGASVETLTKRLCYQIMEEVQRELEELDIKHPNGVEHLLEESTVDDVWKPYKGYGETLRGLREQYQGRAALSHSPFFVELAKVFL